jgi:hypothetical protein
MRTEMTLLAGHLSKEIFTALAPERRVGKRLFSVQTFFAFFLLQGLEPNKPSANGSELDHRLRLSKQCKTNHST